MTYSQAATVVCSPREYTVYVYALPGPGHRWGAPPLLTCPGSRQVNKHGGAESGGRLGADGGRCFMRFLVTNVSLRLVVGRMEGEWRRGPQGAGRGVGGRAGRGAHAPPAPLPGLPQH